MWDERLEKQLEFLKEIDRIKSIFRRNRILDDSRYENDAEHAWHLAVMALVLSEHANSVEIDILRVVKMLLIHDLVEIDTGDTFLYDSALREEIKTAESRAAERIFGLLPEEQGSEFKSLWEEFEAGQTREARFAAALDRLEPCLMNACTKGHAWKKHGISREQVEAVNEVMKEGSQTLWDYTLRLLDEADENGCFPETV